MGNKCISFFMLPFEFNFKLSHVICFRFDEELSDLKVQAIYFFTKSWIRH